MQAKRAADAATNAVLRFFHGALHVLIVLALAAFLGCAASAPSHASGPAPTSLFVQEPPSICGVALPNSDIGQGLFYTPGKYPNESLYMACMRDHGLNTLFPQARPLPGTPEGTESAGASIARMVNCAAQVGLLDTRFPIICYSVGPADLDEAEKLRDEKSAWPELVVQNIDEPNQTQEK